MDRGIVFGLQGERHACASDSLLSGHDGLAQGARRILAVRFRPGCLPLISFGTPRKPTCGH